MKKDIEWMKSAYDAKFKPVRMAALCSISLRQLERACQKKYNVTPGYFARQVRVIKAVELLKKGYSSKAVAAELYFYDTAHLCREFKTFLQPPPQSFGPGYKSAK